MMVAECLVMYDLATSERILARVLRATFEKSLRHDQDYSLVRIAIRSPVRPIDVAAACEVHRRITAVPTPRAGIRSPSGAPANCPFPTPQF